VQKYAKAIVAVLGAAITAALGLAPQGSQVWTVLTIVAAALTAAGVYLVPNEDNTPSPAVVVTDTPTGGGMAE
jgi:hypothetical protein